MKKTTMAREYILCAAIKRKEPVSVSGVNYKHGTTEPDDIYTIEIGRRHNDILSRFGKDILDVTQQGFYTSFGRFVDRKEAFIIAKECGQLQSDTSEFTDRLFSEDLY